MDFHERAHLVARRYLLDGREIPLADGGHGCAKPHDRLRDAIGDRVATGQHRQDKEDDAAPDQPGGLGLGAARLLVHGRESAFLNGDGAVEEDSKFAGAGVESFRHSQQFVCGRAVVGTRRQHLRYAQYGVTDRQNPIAGIRRRNALGPQIAGKCGQEAGQLAFRVLHGYAFGGQRAGGVGTQLVHRRPAGKDIDGVYERGRLVAQMLEDADLWHVATYHLLEPLVGRGEVSPAHAGDTDDRQDRQQVSDENFVANAHVVEEAHRSPVRPHAPPPRSINTPPLARAFRSFQSVGYS